MLCGLVAVLAADNGGAGFPVGFPALDRLALVPVLLALGDGQLALHAAVPEIKPGRDERMAFDLRLSLEFPELIPLQQQFARPERFVVAGIAVGIGTDMRVQQKGLAVLDQSVGVLQVGFAFTNRFDLGTAQCDPGLVFFDEKIIMAGRAIDRRIPRSGGDRVALLGFLRGSLLRASLDGVTGLPGHRRKSYPSIALTGDDRGHGGFAALCYNPASASQLS